MAEPKLKPCPFCGGEAEELCKCVNENGYKGVAYRVRCSACRAQSPYMRNPRLHGWHITRSKAAEAWNRRVTDEST